MQLGTTEHGEKIARRVEEFMRDHVYPAEPVYDDQVAEDGRTLHTLPPVVEELKVRARSAGLWNLFLPDISGLSNLDYARVAELTGWSPYIAPEAFNCSAPDTGNMELLHMFGTDHQKARWLDPLLDGTTRSGFGMTEPAVASSDARNISTSIVADGDDFIINGHKWWTTGAADPRCAFFIVMGKTDLTAPTYRQQSMVIVPVDAPGVTVLRSLTLFGYQDQHGHGEVVFEDVRVPASNILGDVGGGFAMAQARLGPGRVHHAMRCIGMAERALHMMVERVVAREAFGKPLIEQGVVQEWIAESRLAIEQARLLVLKTAWMIDDVGAAEARTEIAGIKVIAPRVARYVLDRAIQAYGGAGVTGDVPLARMWASARILAIADGPDEVHMRSIARAEQGRTAR